jgi:hypothetical protein
MTEAISSALNFMFGIDRAQPLLIDIHIERGGVCRI